MARAKKTAKKKKPTPGKSEPRRLSPAKLDEVIGLSLLVVGALLAISLYSYYPEDPSLFAEGAGKARNLAGRFGAQVADFLFQFVGLTALLVPLLVLVTGWRKLRHRA